MGEVTRATLTWHQGLAFVARVGSGHALLLDSPSQGEHLGASPMELMLAGIAGCTAIDVVAILTKMRVPLTGLEVEISGRRAESNPKYLTEIEIVYRLRGRGVSLEKAERAVALSHSTYCSATASLRPDCRVVHRLQVEDDT
jgi:putative redox protein